MNLLAQLICRLFHRRNWKHHYNPETRECIALCCWCGALWDCAPPPGGLEK